MSPILTQACTSLRLCHYMHNVHIHLACACISFILFNLYPTLSTNRLRTGHNISSYKQNNRWGELLQKRAVFKCESLTKGLEEMQLWQREIRRPSFLWHLCLTLHCITQKKQTPNNRIINSVTVSATLTCWCSGKVFLVRYLFHI